VEKLTCEMAWKLNREKLIRIANRNTFQALAIAIEDFMSSVEYIEIEPVIEAGIHTINEKIGWMT